MANNNNIFNAALAGASAGISSRWLTNTNSASYASQAALIVAFATAFDAQIASDPSGGSRGQSAVVADICAAFCEGRILTADMDMAETVAPLVALYTALSTSIEPDSGSGGGGSGFQTVLNLIPDIELSEASPGPTDNTIDIAAFEDVENFTKVTVTGWALIALTLDETGSPSLSDGTITFHVSWDGGLTFVDAGTALLWGGGGPGTTSRIVVPLYAACQNTPTDTVQLKTTFSGEPVGGSEAATITLTGAVVSCLFSN